MSPTYLVEHAEAARITLDLAEREAVHLRYTYDTLFSEPAGAPLDGEPGKTKAADSLRGFSGRNLDWFKADRQ